MGASKFFEKLEKLDQFILIGLKKETQEELINLLQDKALFKYFFSKISDPEWLSLLEKEEIIQYQERYEHIFNFLIRITSKVPQKVFEVISKMSDVDDPQIHKGLVDVALNMPPELAVKIAQKEIKWLSQQNHLYFPLPEKLGALIVHLAKGGEVDTAIKLARSLLEIFPESKESPHRLEARFDSWDYEDILKKYIPELANTTPWQTLELLLFLYL